MPELLIADALKALQENRQLLVPGGAIYTEAAGAGVGVSDDHLALINEWTRNPVNREQVYTFPALAIDEQTTRNYVRYTAASQRASVSKWVGTPFLFNADSQWASLFDGSDHSLKASSQMGRIYKSELVKTPQGFIGTLVWVYTIKGLDETVDSFIARMDAGLLREVSIHVMVPEGAKCSVCKQMYPCEKGHEIAQDYDGKTCFVETVGQLVPLELSAVACPGSVAAHVMGDEDASNYKVIALREALDGSRSFLEKIMHKAESCTDAACKEDACKERLAAAHAESCTDTNCQEAKCKEKNAPQHNAETCENADCAEEACKEKRKTKADPPEDEQERLRRQNAKPKTALFTESDCPACGRGPASAENAPASFEEALTPIRADFQERVTQIVTAAETKVSEANARAEAAESKASGYDAMFSEFVNLTVDLAVERGTKEATEVDAYREELTKLGFDGVKAVREALNAAAPANARETRIEKLRENAVDRAKRLGSSTQVATENGQARTYERPRLG